MGSVSIKSTLSSAAAGDKKGNIHRPFILSSQVLVNQYKKNTQTNKYDRNIDLCHILQPSPPQKKKQLSPGSLSRP